MLTFNQIYSETQAQTQDTDTSASLPVIKRAINQGMRKFGAILAREWRTVDKTFSTVASQQFYQTPEDCIRIKSITITSGTTVYPLTEIASEDEWQQLNIRPSTSNYPMYYYVKGNDQFGIWPTPAASTASAGTLLYEHAMRDMSADDYTTGTVSVTAGSAAVVGSSTTWTANMVGRTLFVTDGSADGMGYKVSAFTDTTHITLENNYGGATGSGKAYSIGEVPDIPEEFHEALVDYALYRYYRYRRDLGTSKEMKSSFDEALLLCQQSYSSKTSSQYVRRPHVSYGYTQFSNTNRSI